MIFFVDLIRHTKNVCFFLQMISVKNIKYLIKNRFNTFCFDKMKTFLIRQIIIQNFIIESVWVERTNKMINNWWGSWALMKNIERKRTINNEYILFMT